MEVQKFPAAEGLALYLREMKEGVSREKHEVTDKNTNSWGQIFYLYYIILLVCTSCV